MMFPQFFRLLFLFVLLIFLAGCMSGSQLKATLAARETINPDLNRIPSPVKIYLFELKDSERFLRSDFWALTESSELALLDDLTHRTETMVHPGETLLYRIRSEEKSRFIGMAFGFRQIEERAWKCVIPLKMGRTRKVTVVIDEYSFLLKEGQGR